jgi:hypothetical protein
MPHSKPCAVVSLSFGLQRGLRQGQWLFGGGFHVACGLTTSHVAHVLLRYASHQVFHAKLAEPKTTQIKMIHHD